MEAAIWVTADGRKRLKRFSGGFSGQNRWVVGGENGVSGVRLELATQRSMKVHDILGTKWLRRLKRLEKQSEALVGLCYQSSDRSSILLLLRSWLFSWVISLFLTFLKHRTFTIYPLLITHGPIFIYYLFPDRKAFSVLSSHRGRACFSWDKQQQNIGRDGCHGGLRPYTFLKERQTEKWLSFP